MSLSTHVLDAALGRPAAGMPIRLEVLDPAAAGGAGGWRLLAETRTDRDGRARDAFAAAWPAGASEGAAAPSGETPGGARDGADDTRAYRLVFDTAGYFTARGVKEFFYPEVAVCFAITDAAAHYHVPLLLSPFSYSTYRGS